MNKLYKHIEILRTSESGLSSMGRTSANNICKVLAKHYEDVVVTTISNELDLVKLVERQPDLVFLGLKCLRGKQPSEKIWISEFLDQYGICYTGSSSKAIKYERSKILAKQQIINAGLKTSKFYVVKNNEPFIDKSLQLNYPLFVKPASLAGGRGIDDDSVVYNALDLQSRVELLNIRYNTDIIIEEYLPGREFSVNILKDEFTGELISMPIELVAPIDRLGNRLLGQKVKRSNQETVLQVTDIRIKELVNNLAINVFNALGARDYGRIDIRLDSSGAPNFLEANLIPSLIEGYGSFPKACLLNANIDYESMILAITRLGLKHQNIIATFEPEVVDSSKPLIELELV